MEGKPASFQSRATLFALCAVWVILPGVCEGQLTSGLSGNVARDCDELALREFQLEGVSRDSFAHLDTGLRPATTQQNDSSTIYSMASTAFRVWQSLFPGDRRILKSIDGTSWVVCVTQEAGRVRAGSLVLRSVRPNDSTVQDAIASHMDALVRTISVNRLRRIDIVLPYWENGNVIEGAEYRTFVTAVDSILAGFGALAGQRRSILVLAGDRGRVARLLGLMDSIDVTGEVFQYDAKHSVAYLGTEVDGRWSLHELGHVAVDRVLASRVELNSRAYVALSEASARAVGGSMGRPLHYYVCDTTNHRPMYSRETWRRPVAAFFSGREEYNQLVDMLGLSISRALNAGHEVNLLATFRALTVSASAEEVFLSLAFPLPTVDSAQPTRFELRRSQWWKSIAAFCQASL